MRSECHRIWSSKQSLTLLSAVVDFRVNCEHKVMSPERDEEQHIVYSFQVDLDLNSLYSEKEVEELKLFN